MVAPRQATVGDQGADTGRGEERADPATAGAQPLGQRALRGEFDGQFAGQVLPSELLVLSDVGRDDSGDPACLQQQAEPGAVDAAVVADDGQVAGTLLQQRLDQEPWDAGQAETADGEAGAVGDVGDGLGRRADHLVQGHDCSRCAMRAGVMVPGCSALARCAA